MKTIGFFFLLLSASCITRNVEKNQVNTDSITTETYEKDAQLFIEKSKEEESLLSTKMFDLGEHAVLFIVPDSIELEELAAYYGEDFFTIVDDQNFYLSESIHFIDSIPLSYEITKERFVRLRLNHKLKGNDHQILDVLIDTDSLDFKWAAILNDGYSQPIISTYFDVRSNLLKLKF